MTRNWLIPRRTMLKGLGVALALPLLDCMGWGDDPKPGKSRAPVRTVFLAVPNGVNQEHWRYKGEPGAPLPRILAPLGPVMNDVLVINGLRHNKANANGDGEGDHARASGTFLTGMQCRKSENDIQCGVSIDQRIAERVGVHTALPSLELSLEGGRGSNSCNPGYSCVYQANISWRTPSSPMAKENNPKAVFERLFTARRAARPKAPAAPLADTGKFAVSEPGPATPSLERSILDHVLADAKGLRAGIAGSDQHKLDEYLDAVRALEVRIARGERDALDQAKDEEAGKGAAKDQKADNASPLITVNAAGIPPNYADYAKLMMDLMVLAFQTDTTRVATLMFGNDGTNMTYPHIGITDAHHELSHHKKNPVNLEKIAVINTHHVELFSYLVQRLKSLNDGHGNLLDNSMLLYASTIGDGDSHSHHDLPVLLAGRGGGTIRSGRVLSAPKTAMCDLFLGMAARAGCPLDSFGDSKGMLEGLS